MKFTTFSFFTSFRDMTFAHLEKKPVAAKMYKWPAKDLGNGPTTSSPHASKGQEATVGCNGSGG